MDGDPAVPEGGGCCLDNSISCPGPESKEVTQPDTSPGIRCGNHTTPRHGR